MRSRAPQNDKLTASLVCHAQTYRVVSCWSGMHWCLIHAASCMTYMIDSYQFISHTLAKVWKWDSGHSSRGLQRTPILTHNTVPSQSDLRDLYKWGEDFCRPTYYANVGFSRRDSHHYALECECHRGSWRLAHFTNCRLTLDICFGEGVISATAQRQSRGYPQRWPHRYNHSLYIFLNHDCSLVEAVTPPLTCVSDPPQ